MGVYASAYAGALVYKSYILNSVNIVTWLNDRYAMRIFVLKHFKDHCMWKYSQSLKLLLMSYINSLYRLAVKWWFNYLCPLNVLNDDSV